MGLEDTLKRSLSVAPVVHLIRDLAYIISAGLLLDAGEASAEHCLAGYFAVKNLVLVPSEPILMCICLRHLGQWPW